MLDKHLYLTPKSPQMKKLLIFLLVVGVIALITKPSDSDIKEATKAALQDKAGGRNIITGSIISLAVNNGLRINDYLLFKTADFTFDGETKQVAWAAFGYVSINK
jgi:hypothetical protein